MTPMPPAVSGGRGDRPEWCLAVSDALPGEEAPQGPCFFSGRGLAIHDGLVERLSRRPLRRVPGGEARAIIADPLSAEVLAADRQSTV